MNYSEEVILLGLSPSELRTLLALRHLASPVGLVEATMVELGVLTGYSRESLRIALRGLEKASLVETARTKRNLGKFHKNRYQLLPCQPALASTADISIVNSSKDISIFKTTNIYDLDAKNSGLKEIVVASKWRPTGEDTTGDDEVGGFGLFENEKPAVVKHKLSTDKRDPRTRGRRPDIEWTPADVAAEFAFQLGRKYPLLPGLFKTKELTGALRQNRSKFGITALIELEILRLFMGDERLHSADMSQAQYFYKRYLKMFTTHMDQALMNLGMPSRQVLAGEVDEQDADEYVYASDGREFDNSLSGRAALQRYEEKLRDLAK